MSGTRSRARPNRVPHLFCYPRHARPPRAHIGPLIAALRLEGEGDTDKLAELRTRLKGARAALAALNRLREEGGSRREPKKACASTTSSASAAMQRALRPGAQRR